MKIYTNETDYYDYPAVKVRMVERRAPSPLCKPQHRTGLDFEALVKYVGGAQGKAFPTKAEAVKWASEYQPKVYCPLSYYQRFGTACE